MCLKKISRKIYDINYLYKLFIRVRLERLYGEVFIIILPVNFVGTSLISTCDERLSLKSYSKKIIRISYA